MALMLDRMLALGLEEPSGWEEVLEPFTSPELVVFRISNVSEYFFAQSTQEFWGREDFPNVAPPFPLIWVESSKPSGVLAPSGMKNPTSHFPSNWGFLVESKEVFSSNARWEVQAHLFVEFRGSQDRRTGPLVSYTWQVASTGVICERNTVSVDWISGGTHFQDSKETKKLLYDEGYQLLMPFLLALSFLNCRNVVIQKDSSPEKLSRKFEKKHGRPLVKFHVLDINPMKEVLQVEGRSAETGIKKALHICRGHFATYTEDAPLFGKVTGTFWKPQHLRGSAQEGLVLKDYNVKAPRKSHGKV